jgi:FixJ family two-component response regulator
MENYNLPATDANLIIVVDDDSAVRNSLKFSLELEGFAVRTYACGEDLLNEAAFPSCRCLVVDEKLPGISGIDLIARLRGQKVIAPAILITTHPSATLRSRAADAGIPIVEKPLLGGTLFECIHGAMISSPGQRY